MPTYVDAFNTTVSESDGFALVTLYLNAPSDSAVSVSYATSDATASRFSDFSSTSGSVTFAPGETSKTVRIGIVDNVIAAGNKQFNFVLTSPVNATLGRTSIPVTIIDNEPYNLVGTSVGELLAGFAGADTRRGLGGDDTLQGGPDRIQPCM